MEFPFSDVLTAKGLHVGFAVLTAALAAILYTIVYRIFFHPLAGFHGPWYCKVSSIVSATSSISRAEPYFLMNLIKRYGSDKPIRIAPDMLFFPSPSALRDIYWDAKSNTKGDVYGNGVFGPTNLVTTRYGDDHRALRKVLSNGPWTIGPLKRTWEGRFDDQIKLLTAKLDEHALTGRTVSVANKVGEFALDIMSLISFSIPFGNVEAQRDVKQILPNWRMGLKITGFITRSRTTRDVICKLPGVGKLFQPAATESGLGWLHFEAVRQVEQRERQNEEKPWEGTPDLLQSALDGRFADGLPLTTAQKRSHVFLLIGAGADTTATALGAVLRMLFTHPAILARARSEIEAADNAGKLSKPIQFEETRQHLPYFVACIKEALRLFPAAPQMLSRVTPPEGRVIDGHFIPGGVEITSNSYPVQRDAAFYGPDAEEYKPERWMESDKRSSELDAVQFTFGMGYRGCLGKDIALMELYKLLPEVVRRYDIEVENPGEYVVFGGVGFHENFNAKFVLRQAA